MRLAAEAGVPIPLRERIREHRREHPERREFSDRLLESLDRIEREFDGAERDRLLDLAERTFERHVRSSQRSHELRVALEGLRRDHERLLRILELMSERSEGQTLH